MLVTGLQYFDNMITELYKNEFVDLFRFSDTYKNNFSLDGLEALYDYLDDMGEPYNPYKFDMVAIACEFTEYESFAEISKDYSVDTMEQLENNTTVIMIDDFDLEQGEDGRFIIVSY